MNGKIVEILTRPFFIDGIRTYEGAMVERHRAGHFASNERYLSEFLDAKSAKHI